MVIEKYNNNFYAAYHQLTREVLLAMYALAPERLQEWFAHLDGQPEAKAAIARIQDGQDFLGWFKTQENEQQPGIPRLRWPPITTNASGCSCCCFEPSRGKTSTSARWGKSTSQGQAGTSTITPGLSSTRYSGR
jgi:hypothetical protein